VPSAGAQAASDDKASAAQTMDELLGAYEDELEIDMTDLDDDAGAKMA